MLRDWQRGVPHGPAVSAAAQGRAAARGSPGFRGGQDPGQRGGRTGQPRAQLGRTLPGDPRVRGPRQTGRRPRARRGRRPAGRVRCMLAAHAVTLAAQRACSTVGKGAAPGAMAASVFLGPARRSSPLKVALFSLGNLCAYPSCRTALMTPRFSDLVSRLARSPDETIQKFSKRILSKAR